MSEVLRAKPCPICGKPADAQLTPFCSARCADIDLNRWLAGVYAFPASENDETDDAVAENAPERTRGTKV